MRTGKPDAKTDASVFFLILITLLLIGGILFAVLAFRSDPTVELFSGDEIINTLFVIENQGKPLCSYVMLYYPVTRKAAVFDIPGSLGTIIQRINRYDRIDILYDSRGINLFQTEIEGLLGVDIEFSVVMDLENLGKMADLVEGIDIFIPAVVDAYQENAALFPAGVTRLDGDKTKTYVTYELAEENNDMPVSRRQRFFLGFLKRLGERNEDLKNPQVFKLIQSFIRTNMNSRVLSRFFEIFAQLDIDRVNIQAVAGLNREVSGQILIFPHWDGNLIKDIVRQSISGLIRPVEGSLSDRVFTVEVLNGTAVTGLASRTSELLRGFGYDIISIGNAEGGEYAQTVIIDRSGHEESARAFGEIIHCENIQFEDPVPVQAAAEMDMDLRNHEYRADFILILGKDFNERYVTGN